MAFFNDKIVNSPAGAPREKSPPSPDEQGNNRGSFLVAGSIFMLIFMGVAVLGVDMSQYFYRDMQLQKIADGAVLAGAQALDQRSNKPDLRAVRERVLRYIEMHQGPQYADQYEVESDTYIEGIEVTAKHSDELARQVQCVPDITLEGGELTSEEPIDLQVDVLGSNVGIPSRRTPLTSKITVKRDGGDSETMEPWGDFSDSEAGNISTGDPIPGQEIRGIEPNAEVTFTARSWWEGEPYKTARSNVQEQGFPGQQYPALLLQDDDDVPEYTGGYDQEDAMYYLRDYVTDDKKIDLKKNQVIILFEAAWAEDDDDDDDEAEGVDYQDLILLLTLKPSSETGGGGGGGGGPSNKGKNRACDGTYYRIGTVVFDTFKPYFLPEYMLGAENNRPVMTARSIAEARPMFRGEYRTVRKGDTGILDSVPPYEYPVPTRDNLDDQFGIDGSGGSGPPCSSDRKLIRCPNTEDLVNAFNGNVIRLEDQVVYLNNAGNNLEFDPGNPDGIHEMTGDGFVISEGAIDVERGAVINGKLDLVSLNRDINIRAFSGEQPKFRAYLMAPNGDIHYETDEDGGLWGGAYPAPNYGGDGEFDVTPEAFCPTTKEAVVCKLKSFVRPGGTPYSWKVRLDH